VPQSYNTKIVFVLYRVFSETPVRGSQPTRPLSQLRRRVSDAVSRCYRRQLERHHEGTSHLNSAAVFFFL